MPTSPRDLTGGIGKYKRTTLLSNLRDDVGIVPYAYQRLIPFNKARPLPVGVPSTPGPAGPPSEGTEGMGLPFCF